MKIKIYNVILHFPYLTAGLTFDILSECTYKKENDWRAVRMDVAIPVQEIGAGTGVNAVFAERVPMTAIDTEKLALLNADELDIALRLSHLKHAAGASSGASDADKEARKKEKRQQKEAKVCGAMM